MFQISDEFSLPNINISAVSWDLEDHFGDFSEVLRRKQKPWQCPECFQRFRWDIQLRRHETKMNHVNPERMRRRENKYRKFDFYLCKKCGMEFQTNLLRVQHYRWCEKDPKTEKIRESFKSSWSKSAYECKSHDMAHYFTTYVYLKDHLKTHRTRNNKQDSGKVSAIKVKKDKSTFMKEVLMFEQNENRSNHLPERISKSAQIQIVTIKSYDKKQRNSQNDDKL